MRYQISVEVRPGNFFWTADSPEEAKEELFQWMLKHGYFKINICERPDLVRAKKLRDQRKAS
jgi:hypothetical protein